MIKKIIREIRYLFLDAESKEIIRLSGIRKPNSRKSILYVLDKSKCYIYATLAISVLGFIGLIVYDKTLFTTLAGVGIGLIGVIYGVRQNPLSGATNSIRNYLKRTKNNLSLKVTVDHLPPTLDSIDRQTRAKDNTALVITLMFFAFACIVAFLGEAFAPPS